MSQQSASQPPRSQARATWLVVLAAIIVLIVLDHRHLAFLLGVLIFVAALLISVMLHELGHFVTAKRFRMQVTQFFVGFGNTLWSFVRGETEYGIKSLPLGGFCRITGMTTADEVDPAVEPRTFRAKPGWQRMIVMVAGSFMHFVLGLFLFFVFALAIGNAVSTNVIGAVTTCVPASNAAANSANPCPAGSNTAKAPAATAGIRKGDTIVSVAGRPVGNWNQLTTALKGLSTSRAVPVVIERSGQRRTLQLELAHVPGRSAPFLGVSPSSAVAFQRSSFPGALGYAGDQFANTLTQSAQAIGKLPGAVPDLFSPNRAHTAAGNVSSVVGVGSVTGQVVQAALPWQAKLGIVLEIMASLNIFVGAFNLLPLLPLDGGHLIVVIFERLRAAVFRLFGRPDPGLVDMQKLVPVSLAVFAILVGFSGLLIAADIFNPVHLQV